MIVSLGTGIDLALKELPETSGFKDTKIILEKVMEAQNELDI